MFGKKYSWGLLELFFKKPLYAYHFREICRLLGWSSTKTRANINILRKDGLITEAQEKNLSVFRSNRQSEAFKRCKILYNISKTFEIADIIDNNLEDFDAIVFFGSARRGEDAENSDFDFAVVGAKEKYIDFKGIEKEINRTVSLLFIDSMDRHIKENKELSNNILNGFVVKGYLKVF